AGSGLASTLASIVGVVQTWLKTIVDPLPYVFGATGPNAFDCCLPGRTLVYGPHGPKRIDEVQAGDVVYSRSGAGVLVARTVLKAWYTSDQQTFRVHLSDRHVDASANHPFLR